jgi:hypothetical protein
MPSCFTCQCESGTQLFVPRRLLIILHGCRERCCLVCIRGVVGRVCVVEHGGAVLETRLTSVRRVSSTTTPAMVSSTVISSAVKLSASLAATAVSPATISATTVSAATVAAAAVAATIVMMSALRVGVGSMKSAVVGGAIVVGEVEWCCAVRSCHGGVRSVRVSFVLLFSCDGILRSGSSDVGCGMRFGITSILLFSHHLRSCEVTCQCVRKA